MNYHEDHDRKALDAIAKDMGLHDGANRDAALGLPLVMTGSDSTRTLDNLTKWGVVLGADEHGDFGWFSSSGVYLWVIDKWQLVKDYAPIWTKKDCESNPPTIPPPDWHPHDGTKPGPTTPSRTDAASLSNVLDAKHKAAIAYARLLRSLTTQEQKDAACDYMACELEVMELLEGGGA